MLDRINRIDRIVACGEGINSVEKEEMSHKVMSNAGIICFKLREADACFGPLFWSGLKHNHVNPVNPVE